MTTIDAVKKCDELYEAGNIIEAHQAIMVAKDDPDPEVQWRVARMQWKGNFKIITILYVLCDAQLFYTHTSWTS